MAKWSELKKEYQLLHRFMCGVTVTCMIVTVIGGALVGTSAFRIFFWAAVVTIGLIFVEWLVLKIWASWEDVQHGAGRQ